MYNELQKQILHWLGNGRVGLSSKAMAFAIAGVEIRDHSHPYDPDDLNRCLLFLEHVPEARQYLEEVAKLSSVWAKLVSRWNEIEQTFLNEVGLDWCHGNSAPKTYELMKEVID